METAQPAYQENHRLARKNTFQAAWQDALQRALDGLPGRGDMDACCAAAGAVLARLSPNSCTIELMCLNRPVRLALPEARFSCGAAGEDVATWEKILILHYLANSHTAAVQDRLINYRRLRDGALYAGPFNRRCIQPLLTAFGGPHGGLLAAAAPLGGVPAAFADCAVRIRAFPRIDVICCLWKGDAEFGPEASILFDAGAEDFLCAEDIAVLCQQIVMQLTKNRIF